jgi:hypothetical protein
MRTDGPAGPLVLGMVRSRRDGIDGLSFPRLSRQGQDSSGPSKEKGITRFKSAVATAGLVWCCMALTSGIAYGHEPCSPHLCLSPTSGPPGTRVAVDWTTWKIVWNGKQSPAPVGYTHDTDQSSLVLFESPDRDPEDGVSFSVPDVPPGTYAVAFYEVGENYQHYRWDTFTVTGSSLSPVEITVWIAGLVLVVTAVSVVSRRFSKERLRDHQDPEDPFRI